MILGATVVHNMQKETGLVYEEGQHCPHITLSSQLRFVVYTSNLHSARCPRQTLPTVLMRQGLSHLNPLPVLHRQVY